jgi:hypothetical protein
MKGCGSCGAWSNNHLKSLRVVMRGVARVVRGMIAQVLGIIAGGNRKKCGRVCLYTTYILAPPLGSARQGIGTGWRRFLFPHPTPGSSR